MAESKQGAETGAEKDGGATANASASRPGTTPAARTEQLRGEVKDHVLLAPASPMTTLEIPVEGDKSIVLVADGTPVAVHMVEHVVERAALSREGVVAITPEGHVLLAPAS